MKTSAKVALGGLTAALAVLVMALTTLPVTVYALPALAGILLIPIAYEVGLSFGWTTYAAVAVLCLFVTPSWEPKCLFILFFGYYPLLRLPLSRLSRAVSLLLKFLLFNGAMLGCYALLIGLFSLPLDSFTIGGVNLPWLFLLAGNVVFAVYDVALDRLCRWYRTRLSARVRRLFK